MNQEMLTCVEPINMTSVVFDSNAAYKRGATVYEEDRPSFIYVAMRAVPEGEDIPLSNGVYWILFSGDPNWQPPAKTFPNGFQWPPHRVHNENREYCATETVFGDNEVAYIALQYVPRYHNIALSNEEYWYPFSAGDEYVSANPLPNTFHNRDYGYMPGHIIVVGPEGQHVLYQAKKAVPGGHNIPLADQEYWLHVQKQLIANYMVGAAGIVLNERHEILVGERLDYDGNPVLALMGGKPEGYESIAEGVARELMEEVGLNIPASRYALLGICEAMASKTQRCLTAYLATVITPEEEATIRNMEPHKCMELKFMTLGAIKERGIWQNGIMYVQQAHARAVVGAL